MDQTSKVLRHAKIVAIWGTQIVLYPVYAIFQATRLAGRQLGQTVTRSLIRLQLKQSNSEDSATLLRSDFPIQNVLTSVKQALLSGGEVSHSKPRSALVWVGRMFGRSSDLAPSNPYNIQAIASLIDTHNLVLILEGNVIFDTLNDEQQRQIEQRIIFELARYWRWKRKLYLNPAPLALPEDRETVIPPVRVFRQLMAWIQASPVAIATNLFQESELVLNSSGELEWFSPTVPLSAWNPTNLAPKKLPSKKDLDKWAGQLPRWDDLEALVWAAIHYFFGNSRKLAAAQGELPYSAENTPWLSASDVFGGSQPQLFKREFTPIAGTAPSGSDAPKLPQKSTLKFGQSVRQMIQGYLKNFSGAIVTRREDIIEVSEIEDTLVMREIRSVTVIEETPVVAQSSKRNLEETTKPLELEAGEDWIETSATDVEYVRSSWEKLLDWLDTGVLWLEQHFILFWRWLTHSQR